VAPERVAGGVAGAGGWVAGVRAGELVCRRT